MRKVLKLLPFLLLGASAAHAQDAGAFAPFLSSGGPECVKAADIEKAAASFKPVKETTFRFIEALWFAIPPVGDDLPPGDKAELATDKDGHVIAFITDGAQACARLFVPEKVLKVILQVEAGEVEHAGKGL